MFKFDRTEAGAREASLYGFSTRRVATDLAIPAAGYVTGCQDSGRLRL